MAFPSGWNGTNDTIGTWPLGDVAGEVIYNQIASLNTSKVKTTFSPLTVTTGVFPSTSSGISHGLTTLSLQMPALNSIKTKFTTPALAMLTKINSTDDFDETLSKSILGHNGKLYFNSRTSAGKNKLFSYDPNTNRITQISNIINNYDDSPKELIVHSDGLIYFSAKSTTAANSYKLYAYNTSTNTIYKLTNLNTDDDNISNITSFNGYI